MNQCFTAVQIGMLAVSLLSGCATSPPPKVILEDNLTRIEIRADERSKQPHTHPATIPPERIIALLSGLRIQVQSDKIIGTVSGWSNPIPVFTPVDLSTIAGPLSEGLAHAAPNEIVTFYRKVSDSAVGLAYTTGGVFVQDGLAYIIVANFRSLPSDAIIRDVPGYMIDAVYQPLLTLGRKFYRLSHKQAQAEVHLTNWEERYEENKTLVINLSLLRRE